MLASLLKVGRSSFFEQLIGADPYLEIWPPALRSYRLMVTHLLPFWSAPRAAEDAERAVTRSLSRLPATLSEAERVEFGRYFSPADQEAIVLGIGVTGFLDKWRDAIGVELPRPTWLSLLAVDRRWTAGVPDLWPPAGHFLRATVGHDFPVLGQLRSRRAIRAIATMLRDNFSARTSVVGLDAKRAAGAIFVAEAQNPQLEAMLKGMGQAPNPAVQALARAIAPIPARVDAATLESCRALSPSAIVEVVTFISLLQLLGRLMAFYS